MKKVCRTIKLRKYKTDVITDYINKNNLNTYVVCFDNDSWKYCLSKDELYNILEKDHIKPIRYIFDIQDRIIIDRNILIDLDLKIKN